MLQWTRGRRSIFKILISIHLKQDYQCCREALVGTCLCASQGACVCTRVCTCEDAHHGRSPPRACRRSSGLALLARVKTTHEGETDAGAPPRCPREQRRPGTVRLGRRLFVSASPCSAGLSLGLATPCFPTLPPLSMVTSSLGKFRPSFVLSRPCLWLAQ